MRKPYEPPRHLAHLAKTVNAARTNLGWGIHDDGSVGLEHIMSGNPFAGKAKIWGIANIDDNGDIQIVSNGPSNDTLDQPIPKELIDQIVHFYEGEGLNVRNIHEHDPSKEKTAEIEDGMKACPHCGENADLYTHPTLDKFECENCGEIGSVDDLIDFGDDPDPDRNDFGDDPYDIPTTPDDGRKYDDWADYEANVKIAGVSFQGAPAGGNAPASGIAVRPDRQSREEIESMVGGLNAASPHDIQNEYVDKMNEGMGTSFPAYDNPFVNRGGSFGADTIEDHFLEGFDKEAAPTPVGVPGGMGDTRNFDPENQPGFIVVSSYLTPDDNWLFTDRCKGIIAERGGVTSHGAVVARGMGIPAIVDATEASQINPGDYVTMDPNSGRVDVNSGDTGFQEGEVMRARRELVRFVWSGTHGIYSNVTKELTPEMAEEEYSPADSTDKSHQSMIEYLEDNDELDYQNFTFGVIYDDGTAEYYRSCPSEAEMENWLKSTFPRQVQRVVLKETAGNIYAHTAAADQDEEGEKSPKCPECGSHSYEVVAYPNDTVGPAKLRCLNDGTHYEWTLIMNPKSGKEAPEGEDYEYKCPYCGEALTDTDLDEGVCEHCGGSLKSLTSMVKEAPGKEHLPYATPKRNRQYEHILESCREEHPDWSEDRCKELAARTVNKQRAEHGETKSSEDCGCDGSKLVFKNADVAPAINDTDGNPLKIGELYLMHSTQYKIPDVVRIVNINEKRIEAHIDSDVRGMFPIEIDPSEFETQGYSFEPYMTAKEAIATPTDQVLYQAVQSTLRAMAEGHSYYPELMRDQYVNDAVNKALKHFGDPEHAIQALNDADSFGNFMRYYSSKEAARALHISPQRQKDLINENPKGRARNFEKLNLEGTHYTHTYDLVPRPQDDEIDAHFLW